jgi:beta-carotene 3-hydroxylase
VSAGSSLPSPTFCIIQKNGSATAHTLAHLELGFPKQPSPFRMIKTRATLQNSQNSKSEEQKRRKTLERRIQRKREQASYQFAALAATTGIVALATFATYYRIAWHLDHDDMFPYLELASTLLLVAGGMVGMEMYARWAHKALWHENEWGWALHRSHHEPRIGPFEANDVFAIMNAVPAMSLCLYGFLRPDVVGGLCFGAGLGITLFGISYMFVHDGLVHRRFPVGPLANLPVLRRVAAAHQLHHTEKYGGVPFGMFLGPQELEAIGAGPELERLLAAREEDVSVKK